MAKISDKVKISRDLWEWAKKNPTLTEFIEFLEDIEDLRKAKSQRGKGLSLERFIKKYEKAHKIHLS